MKRYLTFTSRAAIAAIATAGLCLISVANATEEENKSGSDAKKETSSLSAKDKMFIKHAYHGGMKEVAMGEMAQKDATSDDVKKVGEKIASDHKDANKEVMDLAEKKGLTLSGEAPKMKKYPGDKEYLMAMQKDHEKDIAAFEKEANDSGTKEDADVKAWAAKTLPTLKDHLKMVNDALEKMK
jgi:putative membrane protein